MATLQKIRNRAGLLIAIVIGVALLAFILGDFLGSGNVATRRSQMVIAKINGESVYIQEYDALVQNISNFFKMYYGQSYNSDQTGQQARMQAWDELLNAYILKDEYKKIGLDVHPEELWDLISGNNPHPIVQQFFTDPETQVFNKSALIRFLKAYQSGELDASQETIWSYLEKEIDKEHLNSKFNQLFVKGIVANKLEAQKKFEDMSKKYAVSYVSQSFTEIADSSVKVTQKDLERYYKENIDDYYNENETRDIEYVTFNVVPSEQDDQAAQKWIKTVVPEFEVTDDTKAYVTANSDSPYDAANYTKEELPEVYSDILFDAELGTMYGPYFENDAYKLAKLAEINFLPDSVRAKHILLSTQNGNVPYDALKAKGDSLMELIENGASFGQLAENNSDDRTSAEVGGDLGWFKEGQMVKPFSDTCFYGKSGDLKQVISQFGLHIVQITSQSKKTKKVQIGVVEKKVVPSSQTIQGYYTEAVRFAGKNNNLSKFREAVESDPQLVISKANTLKKSDQNVMGLSDSRSIVRWAFLSDEDEVSQDIFELGNQFIVAAVTNIKEEGNAPLADVIEDVKFRTLIDKKEEILQEKMAAIVSSSSSIEAIAGELNTTVKEAGEITFANRMPMLRGVGLEPAVFGTAASMEEGQVSQPVIGNNGVYVIKVNSISPANEATPQDISFAKMQLYQINSNANAASAALKEGAQIKDNRANFF